MRDNVVHDWSGASWSHGRNRTRNVIWRCNYSRIGRQGTTTTVTAASRRAVHTTAITNGTCTVTTAETSTANVHQTVVSTATAAAANTFTTCAATTTAATAA